MFEQSRCEHEPCGPGGRQEYCTRSVELGYANAEVIADSIDSLLYSFDVSHDDLSCSATESKNTIRRIFSVLGANEQLSVAMLSQEKSRSRHYAIRVSKEAAGGMGNSSMRYEKEYSLTLLPGRRVIATVHDVDYGWSANGESIELFHSARDMSAFDYDELFAELAQVEAVQQIERTDNENVIKYAAAKDMF